MTLSLTVISYAGRTPPTPVALTLGDRGGVIGRMPGCDWVLEDPEGHVSKKHCRIDFVSGNYRITDTSTNGVYLNDGTNRIGFGVSAILKSGDRLFIGSYDIAVQVSDGAAAAPPVEEADPFGLGQYQEPEAFGEPEARRAPTLGEQNAVFFDSGPLTREPEEKLPSSEDWLNLPTPDHAPIEQLAFQPPPISPPPVSPPPGSYGSNGAASGGLLPAGWNPLDDDGPEDSAPPPGSDKAVSPPPPNPFEADSEELTSPPLLSPPPPLAPPPPPLASSQAAAKVPVRNPVRIERGAAGDSSSMDLLQAFLEGAGLGTELLSQVEPEAVLHAAGQRLRELVSGIRALLIARAQIKCELRVEQTMIAAMDNNPLKISVDDEQALMAMLTPARQGYLAPEAAIQRAFHDLKAHELALLAGARTAVTEALAPLAPELLMSRVKGGGLLAASKKAKYWELYEAEFKKFKEAAEDDPHGPLARALARAYEDQGRKQ
jgi:type VI secretion system FHA domain protein